MSIYVCRFVIYDADGTRFGEIKYIIGHALGLIECSACSITHTSKAEKDEWKNLKQKCEMKTKIIQWHRDEVNDKVNDFIKSENVKYPVVIVESRDSKLSVGLNDIELKACSGSIEQMLEKLKEKQIVLIHEEEEEEEGSSSNVDNASL